MTANITDQPVRESHGQIILTPAAHALLCQAARQGHPLATGLSVGTELLTRHLCNDWGEIDAADKEENDRAVREGGRLVSSYDVQIAEADKSRPGEEWEAIWIVTVADRSRTVILVSSEEMPL